MRTGVKLLLRLCLVVSTTATVAAADDGKHENANTWIRTGADVSDRLTLDQSEAGSHIARVHIGKRSALLDAAAWARNMPSSLTPGLIVQTGQGQILTASITGLGNQIAVQQSGRSNTASILSGGQANMASVTQAGSFNTAAVNQTGQRNSVAISQR